MTELQLDTPLKWPAHISQTERLRRSVNQHFQQGMSEPDAIAFLQDEVTRTTGITAAKLTCNALNINSPMPTQYLGKHPGASVILRVNNQTSTLCCDRWQSIAHNIYALHLAIRQFRQMDEWGIGTLPLLLLGFNETAGAGAASTSTAHNASSAANWQEALGLGAGATLEDANAVYRNRAKSIGESPDALQTLNLAIRDARKYFGSV